MHTLISDSWFSFYAFYAGFLRFLFSWLPFSAGDLFYLLLVIYLLVEVSIFLKTLFSKISRRLKIGILKKSAIRSGCFMLILFLQFQFSWGLNYWYRSFQQEEKLHTAPVTNAGLDSLSRFLIQSCSRDRLALPDKLDGQNFRAPEIFRQGAVLYRSEKLHMPFAGQHRISLKPSLYGYAMNYMGLEGYFNPFTGEAQVNDQIPFTELPFTTCHELAHEAGYGFEYEANMIGYLVATRSKYPFFRYSAHLQALLYVLPLIRRRDSLAFRKEIKSIPRSILADINGELNYWRPYEGATEKIMSLFYTQYLKANNQPQGLQSYTDFVPLLAAWYKMHGYPQVVK